MIVNVTSLKVKPENKTLLVEKLSSEEAISESRAYNMISMMTLETPQDPELVLSTSVWESVESAKKAFSSPFYAGFVKDLSSMFTAPPNRTMYKVLKYQPFAETTTGMYLNITVLKVKPENVGALLDILHGDESLAKANEFTGVGDVWSLEPFEEPGTIFSISLWDKPQSAQNVFADPFYADLLGKMKHLFVAAPERFPFTVLKEAKLGELAVV